MSVPARTSPEPLTTVEQPHVLFPRAVLRTRQVCVLDADPDLARGLSARELASARERSLSPIRTLPAGAWHPERERFDEDGLGLLVLDGIMRLRTIVAGRTSTELLGAGDLLRPWQTNDEDAFVAVDCQWKVCAPAPIALLSAAFTTRLAAWPSVLGELAARAVQRSRGMALRMAISDVPGVELRVQLLFWHLADRWGRVERDGVALPLKPEQGTIGELVGASRGRVNGALSALQDSGRLQRRAEGWLLCGPRPHELVSSPERRRS